jgi:DNA-binding NtrC family response regulator
MATPIRVLIVEDCPEGAALMVKELQRAGAEPTFELARTAAEMRSGLSGGPWDVILARDALPELGLLAALELARELAPDVPVIVVSDTLGRTRRWRRCGPVPATTS